MYQIFMTYTLNLQKLYVNYASKICKRKKLYFLFLHHYTLKANYIAWLEDRQKKLAN